MRMRNNEEEFLPEYLKHLEESSSVSNSQINQIDLDVIDQFIGGRAIKFEKSRKRVLS